MKKIVKLAHTKENFSVDVEGKTQAAIIAEVKAANLVLGVKSLSALLSGEKTTVGDWEAISEEVADGDTKQPDTKEPEAPKQPDTEKQPEAGDANQKKLTPEQAKLAAAVEKQIPTQEPAPANPEKPKRELNDVSHLLPVPGEYRAIKEGSRIHELFKRMCRPEGITKKEACAPVDQGGFGWTDGGWGGIIHWEIKHKGYHLHKQMVNGVAHYHLNWHPHDERHGGAKGKKDETGKLIDAGKPGLGHQVKVKPEEILVEAKKVQPTAEEIAAEKAKKEQDRAAKKAQKEAEKQAAKDAKAASKAAGGGAPAPASDAPPVVGGGTTKRVSQKKLEQLQKQQQAAGADQQPTA